MVARSLIAAMEEGAGIRLMFEEGIRLRKQFGEEQVYDFSLGNPVLEPPPEFHKALLDILQSGEQGLHRYMPSHGLVEVRKYISQQLSQTHGLSFTQDHIMLCVGAGGGLSTVFKALLNPGDEVVVFKPYFPEYKNYISNRQGIMREVSTKSDFQIDFATLESALSEKTCAVLINSPNNPSGVVYTENELETLGDLLFKVSQKRKSPIYLITDEPYANLMFDGQTCPAPMDYYEHTILVTSYSKSLGIPGERIGYIAISPSCYEAKDIFRALGAAHTSLGFVNAPALMQRMIPRIGKACVNMTSYQHNRDILYTLFEELKVPCVKPKGAFYLFPKTPIHDDDLFAKQALQERVVLVPGSTFGVPSHVRLSFCVEPHKIERGLKSLAKVFAQMGEQHKDSENVLSG
jgi:aspartate aminotransferase